MARILIQIPARSGSQRVPGKNLRILGDRPMLAYAVQAAQASRHQLEIYVNSDAEIFRVLAEKLGVRFHHRPAPYAGHDATGDDFTWEFIQAHQPQVLGMINPVCPFIRSETIDRAVDAFLSSDCDTLITCSETRMQGFFKGEGINLDPRQSLKPSQENEPLHILNWAVTLWDCRTFRDNYLRNGSGYLGSKRLLFPIDPVESIKISEERDFALCEAIIAARGKQASISSRCWTPGDPVVDEGI